MTSPSKPEEWKTLDDIRKELPKGHWRHTAAYEELSVATETNRTLEELWQLAPMEKHWLIAFYRAKSSMMAYDALLKERERNKPRPKKKRRGR